MTAVLVTFVQLLIVTLWLLLLARVFVSWFGPRGGGAFVAFVYQVTEPILAPIRRVLPPTAGIDWSPLVAMLIFSVLMRVLGRL
ncbi:MAG: YggT family protein [Chloroflexota bacterium]|nr:YggT family protein [Chloroflexota bacterium]